MSDQNETSQQPSTSPVATGPLLFVLCFALFLGGFWLMAISFSQTSGVVFSLGLVATGLAFIIPIHLMRD